MMEKKAQIAKSAQSTPEKGRKVVEEKPKERTPQKDGATNYVRNIPASPLLDTAGVSSLFIHSIQTLTSKF